MTRHFATLSVCIPALVLVGVVTIVSAQTTPDTVKAVAGVETKVMTGEGTITVPTAPKVGKTRVAADAAPAKTSTLFYTANPSDTAASDTLTYKIGDQAERTVKIEIAPAPKKDAGTPQPDQSTVTPGPRPTQSGFSDQAYAEGFKALFLLFVLAVILESGLAVLFNWRPFVEKFNARAVKPLVSFFVAYFFVIWFTLDIVTTMVNVINKSEIPSEVPGRFLTALVLAGGSSAVNSLMVALGFRSVRTPETAVPKPPETEGWISVSIIRKEAVGPVSVFIGVPAGTNTPFVTEIKESTRRGFRYFLRDPGRFPGSGGYAVAAGSEVKVVVTAATNNPTAPKTITWGPNVIGKRAIIDLEFEV